MSNSAMREALEGTVSVLKRISIYSDRLPDDIRAEAGLAVFNAIEALSAPRLNCEVGTASEQMARFEKATQDLYHTFTLERALAWGQMPYSEGKGEK